MSGPEQAAPGVFRLTCETPPAAGWPRPFFYLLGRKNLVLIDTGYREDQTVAKLQSVLAGNSGRIDKLIITHGHIDHAGAMAEVKAHFAPRILAHELEKDLLNARGMARAIDEWIRDEPVIESEAGPLKVLSTPGHSPGHICLFLENKRALFTGDLVVGDGTSFVGPPDGDMGRYMQSLEKIKQLHAAIMFPGHGPVIRNPEPHLASLVEHRLLREVQILLLLKQGPATTHELEARIYTGLIHPGLYRAAEVTVAGHLAKLEEEGKVASEIIGGEKKYRLLVPVPF